MGSGVLGVASHLMADTMTTDSKDSPTPQWTLGDRLRKARETVGLNQKSLADMIGSKGPTLGGWENDLHKPTLQSVELIADATGVPLWWLLGYESDPGRRTILEARIRNRWFRQLDLGFLDIAQVS